MYKIIGADGKEYGPVSADQIRQWVTEGRLNAQTLVLSEGGTDWKPLAQIPELSGPVTALPPPAAPSMGGVRPTVPNYLVPAILTTVCCCLPFGIPAIVFAAQVNTKLAAGDWTGAQESSGKAKLWCWVAFGLGLLSNIITGIIYGVMMAKGKFSF